MSPKRVTAAVMCVLATGFPLLGASPAQADEPADVTAAAVRALPAKGSLSIRVTGLPPGRRIPVTIYGPNQATGHVYPAYTVRPLAPVTLAGLRPGVYAVSADAVTTAAGRGIPRRWLQEVVVKARTTTTVGVSYLFAPAAAPTGLSVISGNRKATVMFTAAVEASNRTPTNYDYSLDGGKSWTTRTRASTASPLQLGGLVNGRTYRIRLRARNDAGVGPPSVTVTATPAPPTAPNLIDTHDRAAVIDAYRTRFLPTLQVAPNWTGNVATCDPGTPTPAYDSATLTAVNYIRSMTGVAPVVSDPALIPGTRATALMMSANHRLSHLPTPDWTCYSAAGAHFAARSLLVSGASGPAGIIVLMDDQGQNNIEVGHRRLLTWPSMTSIGIGNSDKAMAVDIASGPENPDPPAPASTSWPTAGYFPIELTHRLDRWSFTDYSHPNGDDFSAVTVTVTGPDQTPVRVWVNRPSQPLYGPHTVSWDVPWQILPAADSPDVTYHVRIEGIRTLDNPKCPYLTQTCAYHSWSTSYDVTFVRATPTTP